jgi:hypothetical protein
MASNPSSDNAPESGAPLWLAVGRLQSDTARLIEGQSNLRSDLAETNRSVDETNRRIDETNRRIDRLFYAIVGVGARVIGTLVAVLLRST